MCRLLRHPHSQKLDGDTWREAFGFLFRLKQAIMNYGLLIYVFLIFLVPVAGEHYDYIGCSITIPGNIGWGNVKMKCQPGGCVVKLPPRSPSGMELIFEEKYPDLDVTVIYATTNKTKYLKKFNELHSRYFYVEQNEGYIVEWHDASCTPTNVPIFEYRFNNIGYRVCGPTIQQIGNSKKIIQHSHEVSRGGNCTYHFIPSNANGTETLYMTSTPKTTMEVMINNDEGNRQTGELIVVKNWTSVDLIHIYEGKLPGDKNLRDTEELYAISTNSSCFCDINHITLFPQDMIELHTPGYPDFLCPSSLCTTSISVSERNATEEFDQRVLVRVDATARNGSELRLKSGAMDIRFNENTFSRLSINFLMDYGDVNVVFSTTPDFNAGPEGHFAVQVMNVKVRKECDCSLFGQKRYTEDWTQQISIPSYCEVMFCDWIISASTPKRSREITIKIDDAHDEDQMFIWNSKIMEKYPSDYLDQPRKVYVNDSSSDTHIFFRRNSSGPTSIVNVSWKTLHDVDCKTFAKVSLTRKPKAFISPYYPMPYLHWGSCRLLLTAPKNYYITVYINDLELGGNNYISFWDGESARSHELARFVGSERDEEFSSTGNNMFVEFYSHGERGKRGYHYIAYAVRSLNATEEIENFEETTTESPLSTTEKSVVPVKPTEPVKEFSYVNSVMVVLAEEFVKDVFVTSRFLWNHLLLIVVIVTVVLAMVFIGWKINLSLKSPIPFIPRNIRFWIRRDTSNEMEMMIR